MAKIYAPNKQYSGISASVGFINGVGESENPTLLNWFKEHGYHVEEPIKVLVEEKKEPVLEKDEVELKDMDAEQLKVYAVEHGIDIGNSTSVAGILKKITDAEKELDNEDGEVEV